MGAEVQFIFAMSRSLENVGCFSKAPFGSLLRRQRSEKGLLDFLGQRRRRRGGQMMSVPETRFVRQQKKRGGKNSGLTTSQMFLSLLEPATNCELLELSFEVGVRRSV